MPLQALLPALPVGLALTAAFNFLVFGPSALATPLLALKEAQNCGACHNPGRAQKPPLWRRCTLDCQGCHIDPAGGGARNQWGYYYTHSELSAWQFLKPIDPMQDQSYWDAHVDARQILRSGVGEKTRVFPMSTELTLRARPLVTNLHLTYSGLMLGRIEDSTLNFFSDDPRRYREKYALMIDALPLNTYVRYYRGAPMYGLRRPNHSLWLRERIGLDQFATTEAAEFGLTPNVPFFRASSMQGDPYAPAAERQKGTSIHGGLRGVSFGWHLNGSYWSTASEQARIRMHAIGAGFSTFSIIGYGETNWRTLTSLQPDAPTKLHPSSVISEYTLAWAGIQGIMMGGVLETMTPAGGVPSDRKSLFVDLHPAPFFQFELWRRSETGPRTLVDYLAVAHLFADF